MPKRKNKGEREPWTPTATPGLPAVFAEAEEAEMIATLERRYPPIPDKLTTEFAHEIMRDDILCQTGAGRGRVGAVGLHRRHG